MRRIRHNIHYCPSRLFDAVRRIHDLKTDTALADFLEVGRPLISKVRRGYLPLSAALLLRIHEVTAFDIGWMKETIGDQRKKQRTSDNKLVVGRPRRGIESFPYTRSALASARSAN